MGAIPDVVDLVLYFLGFLSVVVWAIILFKSILWVKTTLAANAFLAKFNSLQHPQDLSSLMNSSEGSFARLCHAGLKALTELRSSIPLSKPDRREVLLQSLRQQAYLEQKRLEKGLAVLASIGSTAPFIGLFGTVWGIMNALKRITATGSAGLDVVAGPIGEALIATAIGIATAIPAVLAYNYFMRKLKIHWVLGSKALVKV
jgi:biopolymer transport protein ExbB